MDSFGGAEAIDTIANETRLAILGALAERQRAAPTESALGFADLRKAAGVRDSGNFSYHLTQLTGSLVEETDGGYELSARGMQVVSTLAAGTYGDHDPLEPTPIEDGCPACGADMAATTEAGTFVLRCENDHRFGDLLSADVVRDHEVGAVVAHLGRRVRHSIRSVLDGFCALCDGRVEQTRFEPDVDSVAHTFTYTCSRCGVPYAVPPAGVALVHPATTWFAYERGVDLDDEPETTLELLLAPAADRVATDPPRYEVTFEVDGDELALVVDDAPSVVEVSPSPER